MPSTGEVLPARTALKPVVLLSLVLIFSWAIWAIGIRVHIPTQTTGLEALLGALARCVFWLLPCGIYLWRYWGPRWYEPIGFGFPLGRSQLIRTLVVTLVVALLLIVGTSIQKGMSVAELVAQLLAKAGPSWQAPLFEEVVFRGVVLSELLNWLHDTLERERHAGPPNLAWMRTRFWLVQLYAALVFMLIHWPWWLSHHGPSATLALSGPVFFTGFILGVVFANTRSIWGCIFLHWLNNELSVLGY